MKKERSKLKIKTRFSSLDIKHIVSSIRPSLENTRLSNIYSVNKKTFLFKFAKATGKFNLLIESGVRLHFAKQVEKLPSAGNFVVKLKKHLKGKRFAGIEQLASERMIRMDFTYRASKENDNNTKKNSGGIYSCLYYFLFLINIFKSLF